ncbi:MAG: exodeoxyribonuclease VII large subunit [Clostridiales bacterium]|nr:exodeoxyribonuclease VII large subunit [Clostridiales bacterium]
MVEFKSVSQLDNYIKSYLTGSEYLSDFSVTGEISAYTVSSRGHAYFTIKDAEAVMGCVMFSRYIAYTSFTPTIGMKVTVTGCMDFYAPSGKLQMQVLTMKEAGKGDLHEQYKQLFERLSKEGLFAPEHKKPLPVLPRRIGVVTSASGRVISDIVNTLRKRNPYFDLLLYPASVQGENCPPEITEGINYFNEKKNVDVIIVARGGGSYEDLFGFNDERIARAVYDCEIPVISAIGHEPDYTIIDYVADLRAATPTAAAEQVMASYDDQKNMVDNLALSLDIAVNQYLGAKRNVLDMLANHKALHTPAFYAKQQLLVVDKYRSSMNTAMEAKITNLRSEQKAILGKLESLNPTNVLKRGYSYVSSADGKAVESAQSLKKGDVIGIVFADGKATGTITDTSFDDRRSS